MTDLRAAVVEAGARKLLPTMVWINQDGEPFHVEWSGASAGQRDSARDTFAEVFNTTLDTLADRADEWADAEAAGTLLEERIPKVSEGTIRSLIAVLRGDTEPGKGRE